MSGNREFVYKVGFDLADIGRVLDGAEQQLNKLGAAVDRVDGKKIQLRISEDQQQSVKRMDVALSGLKKQAEALNSLDGSKFLTKMPDVGAFAAAMKAAQEQAAQRITLQQPKVDTSQMFAAVPSRAAFADGMRVAREQAELREAENAKAIFERTEAEKTRISERWAQARAGIEAAAQDKVKSNWEAQERQKTALTEKWAQARAGIESAAQDKQRSAYAGGQNFLAGLTSQAAAIGKTNAQLLQMRAAELGVTDAAAPMIAKIAEAERATMGLGGGFKYVAFAAQAFVGAQIASSISTVIPALVEAQTTADRLRLSFTAGFGGQRAAAELEFVRVTANKYGLELNSVAKQYSLFAAATKGTSLEGRATREVFLATAESAAVLGMNIEETEGTLRAFGQMASKGKVQAEELTGQLGDRLVGALDKAARAMGVTREELLGMVQRGEVLATDLLPKLAKVMREDVAEAAEFAALSMGAATGRMSNAWENFKRTLVESGVGEYLKGIIEEFSRGLNTASATVRGLNALRTADLTGFKKAEVEGLDIRMTQIRKDIADLEGKAQKSGYDQVKLAALRTELSVRQASRNKFAGDVQAAEVGSGRGNGNAQLEDFQNRDRAATEKQTRMRAELEKVTGKLSGTDENYVKSLRTLQSAYEAGEISADRYKDLLKQLAEANYDKPKKPPSNKGELAEARKLADAEVKLAKARADQQREIALAFLEDERQALARRNQMGTLAAEEYYAALKQIDARGAAARLKQIDGDIKAEEGRKTNSEADRLEKQAKLLELAAKRTAEVGKAARDQAELDLQAETAIQARADADFLRRSQQQQAAMQYAQSLRGQNKATAIALDLDPARRAVAQADEDIRKLQESADKLTRRLKLEMDLTLDPQAEKNIQDQIIAINDATAVAIVLRQKTLTEELKPEWAKQLTAWQDNTRLMREASDSLFNNLLRGAEDAWVEFAKTGKLNVKSMVDTIISELARIQFKQLAAGSGDGIFASIAKSIGISLNRGGTYTGDPSAGSFVGPPMDIPIVPSAKGNAFTGSGMVSAFARGGAFAAGGEVVDRATFFKFARGGAMRNGVAGEAGPEAIMPLRRTASGRLGVEMAGGAGAQASGGLQVVINNNAGAEVTAQESQAPNGDRMLTILVERAKEAVRSDIASGGSVGQAIGSRFGVRPQLSRMG